MAQSGGAAIRERRRELLHLTGVILQGFQSPPGFTLANAVWRSLYIISKAGSLPVMLSLEASKPAKKYELTYFISQYCWWQLLSLFFFI